MILAASFPQSNFQHSWNLTYDFFIKSVSSNDTVTSSFAFLSSYEEKINAKTRQLWSKQASRQTFKQKIVAHFDAVIKNSEALTSSLGGLAVAHILLSGHGVIFMFLFCLFAMCSVLIMLSPVLIWGGGCLMSSQF